MGVMKVSVHKNICVGEGNTNARCMMSDFLMSDL